MKVKIVHIILSCFYKEGYGYQENILPAKHTELGFDTSIITYRGKDHILPDSIMQNDGVIHKYINSDGIPVYVLPSNHGLTTRIPFVRHFANSTKGLLTQLDILKPDIIFCHGIFKPDYRQIIKYKKRHPAIRLYVDNHADYYNTPITQNLQNLIFRKLFVIPIVKQTGKYAETIWGVTPWRVQYVRDIYSIPENKSALLVMGGDEKLIDWENRTTIRKEIRARYAIGPDAFVIIAGGKIDKTKNIHLLIDAVRELNSSNIYLLLFGSFDEEMKAYCEPKFNEHIINLGWIDAKNVYGYFHASDLACFPGTHSVLWEQACASGIPAIFRNWNGGMTHVDVGGNCILMTEITKQMLQFEIDKLISDSALYEKMKYIAQTNAREKFSYIEIAKRSIQID